ncbi:single-stranded DNA-binding protein 3 [Endomicrobiia bacterium]|nr:single-stranded DNA-binding protein 3 [Endomicrobiia bacterium]GHT11518.1 single-stranded DNA-binding protein 3 [Endomicrobiia bacterium]GHT21271.1 single-stranded DNA-binding protein 3 [Endomicrobiia bacterium]GHT27520.1 single-stranded DNA-binding protein 3 [Endomicrobiia bacterium]GHT29404.1 single-stranded DNA-binding protein 3 [Endomicrobiia bacterium]
MSQEQNSSRLPEQNSVIIVGRLTRDPELRRTVTGKAVCSFDIAISGSWKDAEPTFVPIIVWNNQAERCGERLKKGLPVYVEGRLKTNKWEGKDGIKRSRLEVVASRVQFLFTIKQESSAIDAKPIDSINELQEQSDNAVDDDENIPF